MHRMPFFSAMTYLPTVALFYFLFFLQLVCSFLSFILDTFSDTQVRANIQVATTPPVQRDTWELCFVAQDTIKKSRDRKLRNSI